jgi:septal ring factor EnvC (AmiA/AmiB activator)
MRMHRGALITIVAGAIAVPAPAQAPGLDNDRAALISAKQAAAEAEARAAELTQAAAQAGDEATRARTEAAALALRVAAAEQDIKAAAARIALIEALQARQRQGIATRQTPLLHLLAALQTMARRPAALVVAQPGSVADLVHVRLLLADTMPVIAARTAGLREDLTRSDRLRADAQAAAANLAESRTMLADRRRELAHVEQSATMRAQRLTEQAADEAQRALGLGEEARDIADQIHTSQTAQDVRTHLARLDGPIARPGEDDPVPRHDGAARYRQPIPGTLSEGYGEVSDSGVRARGITMATAAGAAIVAPAAGTVLFARPFRSYGDVVILSHGGGWTTTLTGLADVTVKPGARVSQGQSIGRAGDDRPHVTAELRRDGRPIDIVAMVQAE